MTLNENPTMALMAEAGATVAGALRARRRADLAGPTPCADWDLRTLLRHFVGTSGAFVTDQLAGQVEAMSLAWSRPEAWTGSIEGARMPAPAVGELGLIELMLHGWDVAGATGQSLHVSDELGAELLRCLEPTLGQGREFEVYGPEVACRQARRPSPEPSGSPDVTPNGGPD